MKQNPDEQRSSGFSRLWGAVVLSYYGSTTSDYFRPLAFR